MNMKLKNTRGQALLEAVVAINIIIGAMLGIFVLLSNSIGHSRVSTNQSIAVNLAAEGIEVVKSIIDKNAIQCDIGSSSPSCPWNHRLTNCSNGCDTEFNSGTNGGGAPLRPSWQGTASPQSGVPLRFDLPNSGKITAGTYNHSNGDDSPFYRRIVVNTSGDEIRATSEVSWIDRGGATFSVMLEDKFFNWR